MAIDPGKRFKENPFYVLGVSPTATRMEIEREGQKLFGLLEIGAASAQTYRTPVGEFTRDAEMVRYALAQLRIPDRRLEWELWTLGEEGFPEPSSPTKPHETPNSATKSRNHPSESAADHSPFPDLLTLMGW